MNKTKINIEVVTLEDVEKLIKAWRKSCEERGQIPVGVYNFISIDRKREYAYEGQRRIFGDEGTLMSLHSENSRVLLSEIRKGNGGKKVKKGDGIIVHL